MIAAEVLPTTEAEAHRWIARAFVGPRQLVDAYVGDLERARAHIASTHEGRYSSDWAVQVTARHVTYEFTSGPRGRVSIADVLRVAGRAATRGAVDRLTAALDALNAVIRERDTLFGQTYWQRPREVASTPAWAEHCARYNAADREVGAAAAAWWDGPTGEQLDLFGAAS